MKKAMPVGIDDFKKAREGYYWVDKTDFICQLIDNHSEVTLLTRPRRFGKTLTLSMLEWFFSIEKASESRPLFQQLAIEEAGPAYMAHRGQYPVIFLSLKDVQSLDWDAMRDDLAQVISSLYLQHDYLGHSERVQPRLREMFQVFVEAKGSESELARSLLLLMQMMKQYYGKNVILLIDEYDAPVQCAWEHGFYTQCITFMRKWFSNVLKTNRTLDFAVLTGVLRIAKESIFSGLNNLDVCSVTQKKYSRVLGFTPEEIRKMAEELSFSEKLSELTSWHDGYCIGGQDIYNPWSVINYVSNHCTPQPYWVNTSGNGILQVLLHRADDVRIKSLQGLLEDKPVRVTLNEGVVYDRIGQDKSALYTLLLTTGYLTIADASSVIYNRYALRIPNEEVKQVYCTEILNQLAKGIDKDSFDDLFDTLLTGDAESFGEQLQHIILHIVSVYDAANKESFYHGFMLGMTALFLNRDYLIESNRESGYGRFDLALFPFDRRKAGVIMEFKAANHESQLEESARSALRQIQERNYEAVFQQRSIATIWKYGIAFCGKKICVQGGCL